MHNFIVVTDGRSIRQVERRVAKYLPGLDVRLFPISQRRAVLRGPLVRALEIEYQLPVAAWLTVLGIEKIDPIDDQDSAVLLAHRDEVDLPPRPIVRARAAAAAAFDWHLEMTRVPGAWQLLGDPAALPWTVKVGQIDTGYTTHPAFGFPQPWLDTARARTIVPPPASSDASTAPEPGGGIDNLGGFSAGHGTRIGSTIAGRDAGAGGGAFFGAAPGVPLIPVRITDIVWINHAQREFGEAVDHLIGSGVSVINVSLGVFLGSMRPELRSAVNRAYDAGVIMVCAAGNHVNSVVGPASLARTIAVAGVTRDEQPWSGSSFGPEVDFSAPAADLRRANVKRPQKFSYGAGGDGTSYSAGITSAAAALWLTHRAGGLVNAYRQPWQRIEAFRRLAKETSRVPVNSNWQPGSFGAGIIDVRRLLDAALPDGGSLQRAAAA